MISIDDKYRHCNGTDTWTKISMGLLITDGVLEVSENEQCYWFLDIIASYQSGMNDEQKEFQHWKLQRVTETDSFIVTCDDGNDNIFITQDVVYSDIQGDELRYYLADGVILLPSEY